MRDRGDEPPRVPGVGRTILHLYSGNLFGGIEATILALLTVSRERESSEASVRHHVALCFEGRLADRLRELGISPTMLGNVRFRNPWTVWRARRQLKKLIRSHGIDCIVTQGPWSYMLAEPVARRMKIPLAFWNQDAIHRRDRFEEYALAHPAEILIANSRFTARSLEEALGRKVNAIIPAVSKHRTVESPDRSRARIRDEFGIDPDHVVILMFCRFERYKGHTLLIDALGRLRDLPGWSCWLVSGMQKPAEIAYVAELKALAEEKGIADRISYLGQREDIPEILSASDIHCQPNIGPEAWGLTFVEALASGLPCVGVELGAAPEIVTPECGRLVPPNDPQALAEALRELILDKALRKSLGSHGPERARKLNDPVQALADLEAVMLSPQLSHRSP